MSAPRPKPPYWKAGRKLCECGCGEPVAIAKRTDRAHGQVKGQPKRFVHGHNCGPSIHRGEVYARLTVIRRAESDKGGRRRYVCRCSCGGETVTAGYDLRKGHTRSCGCLLRETRTTHGHVRNGRRSPTYQSWQSMLRRTTNPKAAGWEYYGGRGITVCDRWNPKAGGSFENFLEDLGERPDGTSLDRVDVDGIYEPSNTRWATPREQRANQRPQTKKGRAS